MQFPCNPTTAGDIDDWIQLSASSSFSCAAFTVLKQILGLIADYDRSPGFLCHFASRDLSTK